MGYVGNSPAANFASVTKDEFSGDGSTTAFTLSKAATTNGVAVFVENVRQEPTIAYAVSGTTLTFTAAPVTSSGNNIYVLHHNAPASTANHPAGQDLTAVNGTFTGAFTSVGIDDNADATAITIDSSEDVTLSGNLLTGVNKNIDVRDADGHVSGRLRNVSGSNNALTIEADPDNSASGSYMSFKVDGTERAKIENTGKLSVLGDSSAQIFLAQNADSSPYGAQIGFTGGAPNNTTNWFLSCNDTGAQHFIVFSSGTAKNSTGTYTSFSDERLKSDIVDAKSQWEDIKALNFKNFIKFDNPDLKQLGLVAQDVEKTSPNLVFETPPNKFEIKHSSEFGTLYKDGDELPEGKEVGDVKEVKSKVKNVKDSILYMKAVKALQEAMARIETLEAKVKALEEA